MSWPQPIEEDLEVRVHHPIDGNFRIGDGVHNTQEPIE